MQLSNEHDALPREDFLELTAAANDNKPSAGERIANTAQAGIIFGFMAGGVVASAFGIAKATDWLEERRVKRADRHLNSTDTK